MQHISTSSNKIGSSFFAPAASFGEVNGGSYEERIENRQSQITALHLIRPEGPLQFVHLLRQPVDSMRLNSASMSSPS